jgi:anti-sigma regulatory factor (Ser/Thr protein kinase)
MVSLLWDAGDVLAAIELETLWNELALEVPFSLYCAYRKESVSGHECADALARVCHLHSAVVAPAPSEATWEFTADDSAPGTARRLVTDALREAGTHGRLLEDARLVVTELAANAILHARSPFSVSLRSEGSTLRILVRDRSEVMPQLREASVTAPSGRGLRLVKHVASRWGVDLAPDGKTVWAELARR